MARKRRSFDNVPLPTSDAKDKPRYEDPFQKTVGKKIEDAASIFEGKGRNILYGIGAVVVLGLVVWIIYSWSSKSSAEAQTALGKAIEISQAPISETPPPAGSTQKSFKTSRERAEASITAFQGVAEKFGGAVGEKAKYFAAVNRLTIDRAAGIGELETLAKGTDEVGSLSKFALAQAYADDNKYDDSVRVYEDLLAASDPVVAKESIRKELADIYEKQGKKEDAVRTLFELVKAASEAKDLEGKAVPLSATAQSAKEKLKELDPEKAKEIPEPVPDTPGGLNPGSDQ
ncbi:MAG: tetratricopeptide repeat protein [Pyrinomonadaceae bacterium]